MTVDEIVTRCNPCACDRGGTISYQYLPLEDRHELTCSYCGFGVGDANLAMAIEKWNSINVDAAVADDYIQVYAQSGNAEQTAAAYEATNQERFWRSLVKRTPELPADNQRVLLWWQERWTDALFSEMARCWFTKVMVCVADGQYWLPLPTFNPESE